jgi:two-component system sensor kinase FixL
VNDLRQCTNTSGLELDAQLRFGAVSAVTSTMLHEVMQPLTTAMNYLGPLARRLEQEGHDHDLAQAAECSANAVRKAVDLIRRMRSFVTKGLVETEPASLRAMVERVCADLGLPAERALDLSTEFGPGAELVDVDPILFELVLTNLLTNAAEAVPLGERVRVCVVSRKLENAVMIEVTDTGPGVTAEVHPNLFQLTFTTKEDGSGLGLPLCKLIVEAHGGELFAGAPTPLGTTFFITVPAAAGA